METVKLGGQTAAIDADHGFDRETFKQFISFDVGDGAPIYYHSAVSYTHLRAHET